MTENPTELLQRFNRERSESAFRELVRRHSPLVFSTALRKLNGDRAAAQDVMQDVFTLLVRKAAALEGIQLSGWLYRQACRRASNHVRAESRRRKREYAAVSTMAGGTESSELAEIADEVDEAMIDLPHADRDALVLRFFDERSFLTVAGSLGITEEAARKRVSRALERLAALLKRRGISASTVSLGTTMTGMGRTIVPDAVVSQVASQAIKSLPAAGWAVLLPLLKPFLSGVLVSALVLGSSQAVRHFKDRDATASSTLTPDLVSAKSQRPELFSPLPEMNSLQAVIFEIKRANSGPRTALTKERLSAILSRISNDQIREFIALANDQLDESERSATYPQLIYRWAEEDQEAAVSFAILEKICDRLDSVRRSSIPGELFNTWSVRDSPALAAWLNRHWDNDALNTIPDEAGDCPPAPLRDSITMTLAEDFLHQKGKEAMLGFLATIPSPAGQIAALGGFTGNLYWRGRSQGMPPEEQMKIIDALGSIPDEQVRSTALTEYWSSLARKRPHTFALLLSSLEPDDRFQASLQQLSVRSQIIDTPGISGAVIGHEESLNSPLDREAAVIEAGIAAGLPQDEATLEVGRMMIPTLSAEERRSWLGAHQQGDNFDDILAGQARSQATASPADAIDLASYISDPGLRLQLARASFRRLLLKDRSSALAYPSQAKLPADLAREFHTILGEAP